MKKEIICKKCRGTGKYSKSAFASLSDLIFGEKIEKITCPICSGTGTVFVEHPDIYPPI